MDNQKHHNLVLEDRKRAVLSGVREVEDFTDNEILLYTELGELTVKGKKLHIEKADVNTGELVMTGEMQSFSYSQSIEKKPRNFITKLFK